MKSHDQRHGTGQDGKESSPSRSRWNTSKERPPSGRGLRKDRVLKRKVCPTPNGPEGESVPSCSPPKKIPPDVIDHNEDHLHQVGQSPPAHAKFNGISYAVSQRGGESQFVTGSETFNLQLAAKSQSVFNPLVTKSESYVSKPEVKSLTADSHMSFAESAKSIPLAEQFAMPVFKENELQQTADTQIMFATETSKTPNTSRIEANAKMTKPTAEILPVTEICGSLSNPMRPHPAEDSMSNSTDPSKQLVSPSPGKKGMKPGRFSCKYCDRTFHKQNDLARHRRTHTGEKPFDCLFCTTMFSRKDVMHLHVRKCHKVNIIHGGGYACLICAETLKDRATLMTHMSEHKDQQVHKSENENICDRPVRKDLKMSDKKKGTRSDQKMPKKCKKQGTHKDQNCLNELRVQETLDAKITAGTNQLKGTSYDKLVSSELCVQEDHPPPVTDVVLASDSPLRTEIFPGKKHNTDEETRTDLEQKTNVQAEMCDSYKLNSSEQMIYTNDTPSSEDDEIIDPVGHDDLDFPAEYTTSAKPKDATLGDASTSADDVKPATYPHGARCLSETSKNYLTVNLCNCENRAQSASQCCDVSHPKDNVCCPSRLTLENDNLKNAISENDKFEMNAISDTADSRSTPSTPMSIQSVESFREREDRMCQNSWNQFSQKLTGTRPGFDTLNVNYGERDQRYFGQRHCPQDFQFMDRHIMRENINSTCCGNNACLNAGRLNFPDAATYCCKNCDSQPGTIPPNTLYHRDFVDNASFQYSPRNFHFIRSAAHNMFGADFMCSRGDLERSRSSFRGLDRCGQNSACCSKIVDRPEQGFHINNTCDRGHCADLMPWRGGRPGGGVRPHPCRETFTERLEGRDSLESSQNCSISATVSVSETADYVGRRHSSDSENKGCAHTKTLGLPGKEIHVEKKGVSGRSCDTEHIGRMNSEKSHFRKSSRDRENNLHPEIGGCPDAEKGEHPWMQRLPETGTPTGRDLDRSVHAHLESGGPRNRKRVASENSSGRSIVGHSDVIPHNHKRKRAITENSTGCSYGENLDSDIIPHNVQLENSAERNTGCTDEEKLCDRVATPHKRKRNKCGGDRIHNHKAEDHYGSEVRSVCLSGGRQRAGCDGPIRPENEGPSHRFENVRERESRCTSCPGDRCGRAEIKKEQDESHRLPPRPMFDDGPCHQRPLPPLVVKEERRDEDIPDGFWAQSRHLDHAEFLEKWNAAQNYNLFPYLRFKSENDFHDFPRSNALVRPREIPDFVPDWVERDHQVQHSPPIFPICPTPRLRDEERFSSLLSPSIPHRASAFTAYYRESSTESSAATPKEFPNPRPQPSTSIRGVQPLGKLLSPEADANGKSFQSTQPRVYLSAEEMDEFVASSITTVVKDNNQKVYQCNICKKCLSQKGDLKRHLKIHLGQKDFICLFCSRGFIKNSDLQRHIRTRHTREKPYECSQCLQKYARTDQLLDHVRMHLGDKRFECDMCHKKFLRRYELQKHVREHYQDKDVNVKTEPVEMSPDVEIKEEMEEIDVGVNSEKSDSEEKHVEAELSFAKQTERVTPDMDQRLVEDGEISDQPDDGESSEFPPGGVITTGLSSRVSPFLGTAGVSSGSPVRETFGTSSESSGNENSKDSNGNLPQELTLLDFGTCEANACAETLGEKTSPGPVATEMISVQPAKQAGYSSPEKTSLGPLESDSSGSKKSKVKSGKKSKQGKFSNTCQTCGKSFGQRGDLKRHMKIHTGQRDFSCDFCSKAFIKRSDLKRHLLVHTQEKPYSCPHCGMQFSRKDQLQSHIVRRCKKAITLQRTEGASCRQVETALQPAERSLPGPNGNKFETTHIPIPQPGTSETLEPAGVSITSGPTGNKFETTHFPIPQPGTSETLEPAGVSITSGPTGNKFETTHFPIPQPGTSETLEPAGVSIASGPTGSKVEATHIHIPQPGTSETLEPKVEPAVTPEHTLDSSVRAELNETTVNCESSGDAKKLSGHNRHTASYTFHTSVDISEENSTNSDSKTAGSSESTIDTVVRLEQNNFVKDSSRCVPLGCGNKSPQCAEGSIESYNEISVEHSENKTQSSEKLLGNTSNEKLQENEGHGSEKFVNAKSFLHNTQNVDEVLENNSSNDKLMGNNNQSFEKLQENHTHPFPCKHCGRHFPTKTKLEIHLIVHTSTLEEFSCPECDLRFTKKEQLDNHVIIAHKVLQPYVCGYCLRTFSSGGELEVHIEEHKSGLTLVNK